MSNTYSIGVDLGGTNLRVAAHTGGHCFLETIVLTTRLSAGRDQIVQRYVRGGDGPYVASYGDRSSQELQWERPGP